MDASTQPIATSGHADENPRNARPRRRFPLGTVVLSVLAVLLAGVLFGTRINGVPSGLFLAIALAALGGRLEPIWGLLNVVLALALAVLWRMSLGSTVATEAPAPAIADPDAPPRLSPRGIRNGAVATVVLFMLLQAVMLTHLGVTQTLKDQKARSGDATRAAAEDFLRNAYYGNVDAARERLSPGYRKLFTREALAKYIKEWRDSFKTLDALDPKGFFYGLSPEGPYTGIDYTYRGSGGEGIVRMHLIRDKADWKVTQFVFAVKEQPSAGPPAPPSR